MDSFDMQIAEPTGGRVKSMTTTGCWATLASRHFSRTFPWFGHHERQYVLLLLALHGAMRPVTNVLYRGGCR